MLNNTEMMIIFLGTKMKRGRLEKSKGNIQTTMLPYGQKYE
jgi:hypothetical protein